MDFPPIELVHLYRADIVDILDRHQMAHPRVVGLAATGMDLPEPVPVEILVEVLDHRERAAYDLSAPSREIGQLIGHRVILVHCLRGQEELLPGEQMVRL